MGFEMLLYNVHPAYLSSLHRMSQLAFQVFVGKLRASPLTSFNKHAGGHPTKLMQIKNPLFSFFPLFTSSPRAHNNCLHQSLRERLKDLKSSFLKSYDILLEKPIQPI